MRKFRRKAAPSRRWQGAGMELLNLAHEIHEIVDAPEIESFHGDAEEFREDLAFVRRMDHGAGKGHLAAQLLDAVKRYFGWALELRGQCEKLRDLLEKKAGLKRASFDAVDEAHKSLMGNGPWGIVRVFEEDAHSGLIALINLARKQLSDLSALLARNADGDELMRDYDAVGLRNGLASSCNRLMGAVEDMKKAASACLKVHSWFPGVTGDAAEKAKGRMVQDIKNDVKMDNAKLQIWKNNFTGNGNLDPENAKAMKDALAQAAKAFGGQAIGTTAWFETQREAEKAVLWVQKHNWNEFGGFKAEDEELGKGLIGWVYFDDGTIGRMEFSVDESPAPARSGKGPRKVEPRARRSFREAVRARDMRLRRKV